MATYSVVASDGQLYGPADENGLAEWIRQGRVDRNTVLLCHQTNVRFPAAAVPALQPMLGLSQQQVDHLMHTAAAAPAPAAPMAYASPGGYAVMPAEHRLSPFPTAGAVLLSMFVPLFSLIYYGLAHGNLPRRRPDDPSAGKAIGFMFIPFFNIYWVCFFWVRLCTRIEDERARAGLPPATPRTLIITALWCCLGLFIPILNIAVYLAVIVMLIVALAQLQQSINSLCYATRRR
jgi:hypothetical protein